MAKKRIKFKKSFYILIVVIIAITISIIVTINHNKYINSNEYKLMQIGYSELEIEGILDNKNIVKTLLSRDYNKFIIEIMQSKYYLEKHLDDYLTYKGKYPTTSTNDVIALINVGADKDFYANDIETDVSKGALMLVNKFHYLTEEYEVNDLVDMEVKYATSNKKLNEEAYKAFVSMCAAAKRNGYIIYATTAYRSFKTQDASYINLKNEGGRNYADKYAARAGFSEHQTGLAVDITYTSDVEAEYTESEEYKWLLSNASNYGFILRYPENKEYITGFDFEPWHFRYVGIDVAKKIENEGITFDEYYAYYVE